MKVEQNKNWFSKNKFQILISKILGSENWFFIFKNYILKFEIFQ